MIIRIVNTAILLAMVLFFKHVWDNRGQPGAFAQRVTNGIQCVKHEVNCDKMGD